MKQVGIIPLPRVGGALSARWEEVSRDFDFDVKLIGRPYWVIFDSVQNLFFSVISRRSLCLCGGVIVTTSGTTETRRTPR